MWFQLFEYNFQNQSSSADVITGFQCLGGFETLHWKGNVLQSILDYQKMVMFGQYDCMRSEIVYKSELTAETPRLNQNLFDLFS